MCYIIGLPDHTQTNTGGRAFCKHCNCNCSVGQVGNGHVANLVGISVSHHCGNWWSFAKNKCYCIRADSETTPYLNVSKLHTLTCNYHHRGMTWLSYGASGLWSSFKTLEFPNVLLNGPKYWPWLDSCGNSLALGLWYDSLASARPLFLDCYFFSRSLSCASKNRHIRAMFPASSLSASNAYFFKYGFDLNNHFRFFWHHLWTVRYLVFLHKKIAEGIFCACGHRIHKSFFKMLPASFITMHRHWPWPWCHPSLVNISGT